MQNRVAHSPAGWLRPYVRLAKDESPAGHKRPVDPGWQEKLITLGEALDWVRQGGGLGLAIHHTKSVSCVDIDSDSSAAAWVAGAYGQMGALVCKTPRGYHIFLRRPLEPPGAGRYVLHHDGVGVEVEWHPGGPGDVRQLVLPIAGTPRARLGGVVHMAEGQLIDRPCGLEELELWLASLPELSVDLEPLDPPPTPPPSSPPPGAPPPRAGVMPAGADGGFARRVWGSIPTPAQVRAWALSLREGERHSLLTQAAASLAALGAIEQLFVLYDSAEDVFKGERTAREEMRKICATAVQKYAMTRMGSNSEGAPKRARGRPRADERVDEVLSQLKDWGCRSHVRGDGERFLLVKGVAVAAGHFWEFLQQNAVGVGETTAKAIFERAFAESERDENAIVLTSRPAWRGEGAYFKLRRGKGAGVYYIDAGGGRWVEDAAGEGVYLLFKDERARVFFEDASEKDLRLLEEVMARFVQMEGRVALALLAPILVGQATGSVIVEGPSGSGKTTLSILLQGIADGADAVSVDIGRDLREWRAVASMKTVAGIDESQPGQDLENFIKTAVTGGNYVARKYYTTAEAEVISVRMSAVFSSVSIDKIPSDLARRSVVINLSRARGRSDITEAQFREALAKDADRFYSVLLKYLDKALNFLGGKEKIGGFGVLLNGKAEKAIPAWADRDSKRDWAIAAWSWGVVLGVEEEVREAWKRLRSAARSKGLGVWEDVIKLAGENGDFARALSGGLTYGGVAKWLIEADDAEESREDGDVVKSIAAKLRRSARQVQTALMEEGWEMDLRRERVKGLERWLVYLRKEDDSGGGGSGGDSGGGGGNGSGSGDGSAAGGVARASSPAAAPPRAPEATAQSGIQHWGAGKYVSENREDYLNNKVVCEKCFKECEVLDTDIEGDPAREKFWVRCGCQAGKWWAYDWRSWRRWVRLEVRRPDPEPPPVEGPVPF